MSNYIKSELYRLKKSKLLWIFVIWVILEAVINPFLNNGMTIVMIEDYYRTIMLSLIVLGNEFKNKTLQNTVSMGITENQTYFGKIIVTSIIGIVAYVTKVIVSICFSIMSYGIELEKYVPLIFRSFVIMLVPCFAAIVLAVTIKYIIKSNIFTAVIWWMITCGLSGVVEYILPNKKVANKVYGYISLADAMHKQIDVNSELLQPWYVQEGIIKILVSSVVLIVSCVCIKLILYRKSKCNYVDEIMYNGGIKLKKGTKKVLISVGVCLVVVAVIYMILWYNLAYKRYSGYEKGFDVMIDGKTKMHTDDEGYVYNVMHRSIVNFNSYLWVSSDENKSKLSIWAYGFDKDKFTCEVTVQYENKPYSIMLKDSKHAMNEKDQDIVDGAQDEIQKLFGKANEVWKLNLK